MDVITKNLEKLLDLIKSYGFTENIAITIRGLIVLILIFIIALIFYYITKRIIISSIKSYVKKSKNTWDDIFLHKKVFNRLSYIAPALVIYYLINYAFQLPFLIILIKKVSLIYIIVITLLVTNSFLEALHEIYLHFPLSKDKPIKGFLQIFKIFLYTTAVILIISLLTSTDPLKLLTGLGALAAVLIFVFKDTLLGLVASIQISANNMLKPGDWIEMPARNADGTVLEITINTVKIQNWDKTITTIPTYALVSESFFNWRGMEESEGRRIRLPVFIDMNSVRFLGKELSARLKKIRNLKDYLSQKEEEMRIFNKANGIDDSSTVNGIKMTNLGAFRKYLELYLKNNPRVNTDMSLLVRHLKPTGNGLPLEILVFSRNKDIQAFEELHAEILDHILSILPEFDLRIFQNPTGEDIRKAVIKKNSSPE